MAQASVIKTYEYTGFLWSAFVINVPKSEPQILN